MILTKLSAITIKIWVIMLIIILNIQKTSFDLGNFYFKNSSLGKIKPAALLK